MTPGRPFHTGWCEVDHPAGRGTCREARLRLAALTTIPVAVDAFVHLSLLADHARELVRIHDTGQGYEDRTEGELVEAMREDLEHIPPVVRA